MLKALIGRSEMVWEMNETVRRGVGNEQWELRQRDLLLLMAQLAVLGIEPPGMSGGVHSANLMAIREAMRRAKRAKSRTENAFQKAKSSI